MSYHLSQYQSGKRYTDKKKRLGLCTKCNESSVPGKTLCKPHADRYNKTARDKRKTNKNIGENK